VSARPPLEFRFREAKTRDALARQRSECIQHRSMGPGSIAGLTFEPDGMFGRTDERRV